MTPWMASPMTPFADTHAPHPVRTAVRKRLQGMAFVAMCVVPITVAVFAMSPWGNGWNYFICGTVALTGPPAYFIFKRIYGGRLTAVARPAAPASGVSRRARRRRARSAASGRSTSTSAA